MKKKGFTLIEVMAVIVIVGLLASFAYPRYRIAVEKQISAEGVHILTTLWGAQLKFFEDTGNYATTAEMNLLDVQLSPSQYFPNVALFDTVNLAVIERRVNNAFPAYYLRIDPDARIRCSPAVTNPFGPNICQQLGF